MKKTVKHHLDDIYDCIKKIEEYTESMAEAEFSQNTLIQDSVEHRLQIIGEAAKRIPDHYKKIYPEVPWQDITGTRDHLVHEYDGVNMSIIWDVVKNKLPELKSSVEIMLKEKEHHEYES